MSRKREKWVYLVMTVFSLAALGLLVGCPPFQAKKAAPDYQDVALIRLQDRFVPAQIVLVKGRSARIQATTAQEEQGQAFKIPFLALQKDLTKGEVTTFILSSEQLDGLNGKAFTCANGLQGTFRVVDQLQPLQKEVNGAVELAVVLTSETGSPDRIVVKKGVPVRLYVMKTLGGEDIDEFTIENFPSAGKKTSVQLEAGEVGTLEFTPTTVGEYDFHALTTPASAGKLIVVE